MKRQPLLALLRAHQPANQTEAQMLQKSIAFVEREPNCFERWLETGHVTGSAWIVDETRQHALLMHHRKLDRWFQPGGHADGESDILQVALKEAQEETGLADFKVVSPAIFDVDVHLIPARGTMPAHFHYDIRFLLQADARKPLLQNEESNGLKWIELANVWQYNNSESILRMVDKIILNSAASETRNDEL